MLELLKNNPSVSRPLDSSLYTREPWQMVFVHLSPHRVILERSEGSRWVRREAYKRYFVGRCLGAAVLLGLNRSLRREQAPALLA